MYHMYASKLDLKGFFFSKIEPLNPHFAWVMSLDTHFWGKSHNSLTVAFVFWICNFVVNFSYKKSFELPPGWCFNHTLKETFSNSCEFIAVLPTPLILLRSDVFLLLTLGWPRKGTQLSLLFAKCGRNSWQKW